MRKNSIECDICEKEIDVQKDDAISFIEINKVENKLNVVPLMTMQNMNKQTFSPQKELKTTKLDICKDCTELLEEALRKLKLKVDSKNNVAQKDDN